MTSYRFCRPDDIPLLVEAVNLCYIPHFPDLAAITISDFKRDIRELQVWCSSCMVAFDDGGKPIAVVIGCKRSKETFIYQIGVRPGYERQGHARHILTSLAQKLAVLGPPRIIAEIPSRNEAMLHLFESAGFRREEKLVDFALTRREDSAAVAADLFSPLGLDDLEGELMKRGNVCWERSLETLRQRREKISGVALVGIDRLEGYLLNQDHEILAIGIDGTRPAEEASHLLRLMAQRAASRPVFRKVSGSEVPLQLLEKASFEKQEEHCRLALNLVEMKRRNETLT